MTEELFGFRLRRERERRKISLSSISATTKISESLFQALERGDVSRWPSGIFRRAFIRAYAEGIGLDPDEVMQEFLERFPDPAAPIIAAAAPEATASSAPAPAVRRAPPSGAHTVLRLTLAETRGAFLRGRLLAAPWRRLAAVGCDAAIVMAIAGGAFVAWGQFWVPLAISMFAYYCGGIVLLGNSPGVYLWAPGTDRPDAPSSGIGLRAEMTKAADAFLIHFNRAASPDRPPTLRSEPGASRP